MMRIGAFAVALFSAVSAPALAASSADAFLAEVKVAPKSPAEVAQRCDAHEAAAMSAWKALEAMPASADPVQVLRAYDDLYNLSGTLAFGESNLISKTSPDPTIRKAAEECVVRGGALLTKIGMSRPIYDRLIRAKSPALPADLRWMVDRQIDNYRRSGVDKDEATRKRIAQLLDEVTATSLEFQRNIREDIREVKAKPEELAGLPRDFIDAHPAGADGMVTLRTVAPDVQPVLQYADNAALRRRVQEAWLSRAHPANDAVLKRLFTQRAELAKLLGYPNYAAYDLANKMAQSPARTSKFIEEIAAAARPASDRDAALMLARLKQQDPSVDSLRSWSANYAQRLVRLEKYDVDPAVVRQYFRYDKVRDGIFKLTEDLFQVQIRPWRTELWAPKVQAFEMVENGKVIGRFYLDMHPRDGKYTHAQLSPVRIGIKDRGVPVGALLTNFPEGLMEHAQVETVLHEFGHLLHWIFAGNRGWAAQNFGEVENDVTEAPSTLLEEWVWDYDTLARFATNDKGETIPKPSVEKMRAGRFFGQGFDTMRQLGLAAVSLDYYSKDSGSADLTEAYWDSYHRYAPAALPEGTHPQTSFGHLDGYAASYYTYQWSEALASDLLSRFRKAGLRDTATAKAYRDLILAPGGSDSMNVLARRFLGREWSVDSYRRELEQGGAGN